MPNYLDYTVKLEPYAYPTPGAGSRAENWFNRRFDDVLVELWKDIDVHAISIEAAPNGDGGAELAEKLNKVISRDCGDWLRIDFDLDDSDIPDVATFSSAVWQQSTGGGHEADVVIALYGPEQWSKSIESVVHYMKVKATITW